MLYFDTLAWWGFEDFTSTSFFPQAKCSRTHPHVIARIHARTYTHTHTRINASTPAQPVIETPKTMRKWIAYIPLSARTRARMADIDEHPTLFGYESSGCHSVRFSIQLLTLITCKLSRLKIVEFRSLTFAWHLLCMFLNINDIWVCVSSSVSVNDPIPYTIGQRLGTY